MTATFADLPRKLDALQGHLDDSAVRGEITVSRSARCGGRDAAEAVASSGGPAGRGVDVDALLADESAAAQLLGRFVWGDPDEVAARVRSWCLGLDGFVVNLVADADDTDAVALAGETLPKPSADPPNLGAIRLWARMSRNPDDSRPDAGHTRIDAPPLRAGRRVHRPCRTAATRSPSCSTAMASDGDLQHVGQWTNLSETTFVLPPPRPTPTTACASSRPRRAALRRAPDARHVPRLARRRRSHRSEPTRSSRSALPA